MKPSHLASTIAALSVRRSRVARKNPFRGIACGSQPHWSKIICRGQKYFRHIEGARDTRKMFNSRYRDELFMAAFGGPMPTGQFRDTNPHPVAFLP